MRRLAILLSLIIVSNLYAKETTLVVNISPLTPVVIMERNKVTGFSIELWEEIAKELDVPYKYKQDEFSQVKENIQNGKYDVGICGMTITEEREKLFDFSLPVLNSGQSILIPKQDVKTSVKKFWKDFFAFKEIKEFIKVVSKPQVLRIFLYYALFIAIASHIMWFSERDLDDMDSDEIDDRYFPGIFESIYFCIVTTSTVGYGDITVKKKISRTNAGLLIFFGIAVFCNVTALLSADYTSSELELKITCVEDLKGKKVGTVKDTVTVKYLEEWGAIPILCSNFEEACLGMSVGEMEAVVFDTPVIKHYAGKDDKVQLVPGVFHPEYYGFCFPSGSRIKELVNVALLKIREREENSYDDIHKRWFGD